MSEAATRIGDAIAEPEARELRLEFHGEAGEYFRIWIVNLLLTIATLGIYSAWAKVRTERYFAANTTLDGAAFDYHATPMAILRGRLIAAGYFAAYVLASIFVPWLEVVLIIIGIFAFPWAIHSGLSFRAHNTSWRGVRFAFYGEYFDAFLAYLWMPFIGIITLFIGYPYAIFRQRQFIVENAAFGTQAFKFAATAQQFYKIFGVVSVASIVVLGAVAGLGAAVGSAFGENAAAFVGLLVMPFYFLGFAYVGSQVMNLTYDRAQLGPHELRSSVPAKGLAWIYATNGLAILASLGMLIPWAQVRLTRFRLGYTGVLARGSLEEFVAVEAEEVTSLGAELGEGFDIDLGL